MDSARSRFFAIFRLRTPINTRVYITYVRFLFLIIGTQPLTVSVFLKHKLRSFKFFWYF